jgi:cation transport ATPase
MPRLVHHPSWMRLRGCIPSVAHRKERKGLAEVKLADIRIGEVLAVLPHEICRVDRLVLEGRGVMDEISKTPGSLVPDDSQ